MGINPNRALGSSCSSISMVAFSRRILSSLCSARYWFTENITSGFSQVGDSSVAARSLIDLDEGQERALYKIEFLSRLLRKSPFWFKGHLLIARELLELGRIEESYCACQTAQRAAQSEPEERLVVPILAANYLATGQFGTAKAILEPLVAGEKGDEEISELLAAAHMGLGERVEAEKILSGLPTAKDGGRNEAVLLYLQKNTKEKE
ncbi:MAG: hypothetical protein KDD70_07385, partial [Bdellovibrionales bacterium]|nr:hypothetical protein [Bdellovibrionales bacterium]